MITDRTAADVAAAKDIRTNKVQTGAELTVDEIATLERGTVTPVTLNRIELECDRLAGVLEDMGYYDANDIICATWSEADVFNEKQYKRILGNIKQLRNAFFTYPTTPATPAPKYDYKTFNAIEQILVDLDAMTDEVKALYRECGAYECGQEA